MEIDPEHTQTFEYLEDAKTFQMEINDGGAAAIEFASKEEDTGHEDEDSDQEMESDKEMGELLGDSEDEDNQKVQTVATTPAHNVDKRVIQKKKRDSLEDWMDTMSSTLLAVKELLAKSSIMETEGGAVPGSRKSPKVHMSSAGKKNGVETETSFSETTISIMHYTKLTILQDRFKLLIQKFPLRRTQIGINKVLRTILMWVIKGIVHPQRST